MRDSHILRAYDEALATLTARLVAMGDGAAEMVAEAGVAFRSGDQGSARAIIARDLVIDREQEEINREVVNAIARYQPIAIDLRKILAIEHMAANVERVADHAKSIAKRAIANGDSRPSPAVGPLLEQLHQTTLDSLRQALRALRREDPEAAQPIVQRDDRIDALYDDLFHAAVAELRAGSDHALGDVQALFVGKSLERIGDHATNIAEEIRFMTLGEHPPATRNA
jgi:phosphate transport system protein